MGTTELPIVGSIEYINIIDEDNRIPAKIDTGADSSSIWASSIEVNSDGELSFKLFAEGSEYYSGKVHKTKEYGVRVVRSSNGEEEIRYRVNLLTKLAGKKIRVNFTLSDRQKNHFPVLIGRHTLSNRFLVDVSKTATARPPKNSKTPKLSDELRANPLKFHQKYVAKEGKV